jgi:hypothetical protein
MIGLWMGLFICIKPLDRLRRIEKLFSYDFSSATDRFSLNVNSLRLSCIWNSEVAMAWVVSGLGTNVVSVPCLVGPKNRLFQCRATSSWLLFALAHQWCGIARKSFLQGNFFGDDIVIGVQNLFGENLDDFFLASFP